MIIAKFSITNILLIIIIIGVIVYGFIKIKKRELKIIRLFLLLLFILLLLNIEYKIYQKSDNVQLIFMIDNSHSMKINDRFNKVKNFLEKIYKDTKKNKTKIYLFNETITEIEKLDEIILSSKITKINASLDEIISNVNSPSIVFLFSDGINLTDELPSIKKENLKVIPVFVSEDDFKDKSILDIRYSKIGFKGIDYEIKIYVFNWGYPSNISKIKLIDIDNNQIILQDNFYLKEGINEITLKFVPDKIGVNRLKLVLDSSQNEATYENNTFFFTIDVKKSKIRILYLCGKPSAEYFNLRSLIKNDPYIDLVSFVILRNPESVAIVPDTDSALIPFPTYDIFVKEINTFDLLIFENFTYRKFGIPLEYLENVRRFVMAGGGFIMIGGENSFFLGGYKFSPIEDILPVYLSEKERFIYEEIKPDFVNLNDNLTKIEEERTENEFYWKNIPFLGNYQTLLNKENAVVLLKYKNNTLMCYQKVSKGRVFVSATNSTWRWRLGSVMYDKYNFRNFYDKFWKKVIYYCAGLEDIKNINIICDETYGRLEEINLNIFLSNIQNMNSIEAYLILPDLSKKTLNLKKIKENKYFGSFIPTLVGRYILNVVVKTENNVFREQKYINVIDTHYKEMAYLKPNLEYMEKLANFYDTKVENINNLNISQKIFELKKEFSETYAQTIQIYKNPILGLLFILIFILEIYIARFK